MKNTLKPLLMVALIVYSSTLWAQELTKEEKRAKFKAFREDAKAYNQQNVWPVVKAQRQKLDAVMSDADKQKVATLRAQMKESREKMRAFRKEMREQHKPGEGRPQLTEAQKTTLKAQRKARRKAKNAAWDIADKYETTIEKLLEEMKPKADQWKKDLKALRVKHFGERKKGEHKHMGRRGKRRHHGKMHRGMRGMRRMLRPVGFVLIDPASNGVEEGSDESSIVYPNPSADETKVNFSLTKSENVRIQLMDANGKLVKEVLNESKAAGSHAQTIDMSNLKNGTYYVIIKTSKGTETKRLIKR
ncbi:MAG TPA: hypothetical protein DCS93_33015 [Microscillaceae bacterium]|nr:hypothetical protein [Microscillaceae bacterium]